MTNYHWEEPPGYTVNKDIKCCLTCENNHVSDCGGIYCAVTQDDDYYEAHIDPLGICELYKQEQLE